ncbi:hypothetical protein JXI42_13040 [bacterium]|nr:hypothetical protein [bacterium]
MTDYSKAESARTETPGDFKLVTFPARGNRPVVELEYPEFQSLCPVSGRHDQGTVVIRYKPLKSILEQKSIREYLSKWRNLHNWQEFITEHIAGVIFEALEPEWLTVEISWASRGGILVRTFSEREGAAEEAE